MQVGTLKEEGFSVPNGRWILVKCCIVQVRSIGLPMWSLVSLHSDSLVVVVLLLAGDVRLDLTMNRLDGRLATDDLHIRGDNWFRGEGKARNDDARWGSLVEGSRGVPTTHTNLTGNGHVRNLVVAHGLLVGSSSVGDALVDGDLSNWN